MSKTDWEKLKSMTDEEIEQAALSDPDAQPTTLEFWRGAKVYTPEEGSK